MRCRSDWWTRRAATALSHALASVALWQTHAACCPPAPNPCRRSGLAARCQRVRRGVGPNGVGAGPAAPPGAALVRQPRRRHPGSEWGELLTPGMLWLPCSSAQIQSPAVLQNAVSEAKARLIDANYQYYSKNAQPKNVYCCNETGSEVCARPSPVRGLQVHGAHTPLPAPNLAMCSLPLPSPSSLQSLPLLGSLSNSTFVLVNGGYAPVMTMKVGAPAQWAGVSADLGRLLHASNPSHVLALAACRRGSISAGASSTLGTR